MAPVETLVSAQTLLGDALPKDAMVLTSASFAQVYLNKVPAAERSAAVRAMLERLKGKPYLKAWSRETLPAEFEFVHPERTGDVVISLVKGYAFTSRKLPAATGPISMEPSANRGNHGYIVGETPEMLAFMLLCPYRGGEAVAGKDLGAVDSLRLHPTAAKLLGIEPAGSAKRPALDVR
jgi:hypothetical protein